ncbi:5'-nucleotidase C-terminal domain-containing protein [Metabacillus endolithicus]|uniref:5'-nucleotidase C-terminal domain-containing protein n=2 Tax=Metabacillus endolithicus TaxID=1535204 RepID=A0ABW5C4D0_9BACI
MRQLFKKLFSSLLVLALILSTFLPVFSKSVKAENAFATDLFISEYIEGTSFNKAIEIYNGTGQTVDLSHYKVELYSNGSSTASQTLSLTGTLENGEVYVLAHNSDKTSTDISNKADIKNGTVINFNGDDAFALKKNDQLIDVIGTIGVRENFATDKTLVRNPNIHSGTTTYTPDQWTTYNSDTLTYLGSHTIDGTAPTDPGDGDTTDPEQPETGVLSIADAKQKTNQTVTIEGIVTADNSAIGGGKLSTFIQDETAGINIYASNAASFIELTEGKKVRVTGSITQYRGLAEIVPTSIVLIEENSTVPTAQSISLADLQDATISEPLEGKLVKVSGYVQSIPSSPAGGGYNVSLVDENYHSTTLRVMEEVGIENIEKGKWYEITAILSQYDSYQLIPRKQGDFTLLATQPEPPTAAGEYSAVVESVVDGDTIHITNPVLGSTKVRYVNMDTPETYHKVVTEADQNQLDFGNAAKAYMNTLLKAGDEIILKIGEEPTDAYGRLLAQVIRKSDNMNTNLEMVRKGYASSYFIWPVGSEEDYNAFQAAVKAAKDEGLGIWNPENLLMELPFEFRAREQGKGLLRYVGNSDNKEYVSPENWADVPVEKRIFFASTEEAEANGYTAATDSEPNENVKVQLLGVNDLHGKIDITGTNEGVNVGRADYLAAYLRQREATNPNTLIVHPGDMVGGSSPVSALLQDEPTVEIMESIGFDVGTVGNHEFDEGVSEMLRLINGGEHPNGTANYDGIDFPMIAANVSYKDTHELVLPPYAIEEVEGEKIGFIGVATTDTPNMIIANGNENVEFTDEVEAINKYVPELQEQGVEAIVVLSHVPGNQSGDDRATGDIANIANNVNDAVDVIFAAHNHVKLNAVVDNKLIVQAWEYGKAFVDVDLEIDPTTGDIIKKSAEIVDVVQSNIEPDAEVSAILEKYLNQVGPKLNEVIGQAATELTGGYAAKGEIGDNALGNLIADGMAYSMNSDFALMNGGGIRDDLNSGDITWNELFNIQPFGNTLVKLEVTGDDLRQIINSQFSSYGPDVSISGFRYTWDSSLGKYGQVVDLFLPNGERINPDETYTVTVNNYMYPHTNDKYLLAALGENPVQGPEDLQATVDFVKSFNGQPISYAAEGRISEVVAPTDTTAPVTEIQIPEANFTDGSFLEEVTVELSATDSESEVKSIEYNLDDSEWVPYVEAITLEAGEHKLSYRSIDSADNVEETKVTEILVQAATIDHTKKLVQASDAKKGVKVSILAQLEIAERNLERKRENKFSFLSWLFDYQAYDALKRLNDRIENYPDKLMSEDDRKDITTMLTYIVEHKAE